MILTDSYYCGEASSQIIYKTIGEVLAQTVERYPDNEALVVTHQGIRWTWRELQQEAITLAAGLLATGLDPTTRRLALPGGEPVLLSDTVGFINRLPHGLVESFKGTLEVASRADYLVHVVDAGAPDPEGQIAAVREVLGEIDAASVRVCLNFWMMTKMTNTATMPAAK